MQPYFDPTRKTTSKKNRRRPQKTGRQPKKIEDDLRKNVIWPQAQLKKLTLIGCDIIVKLTKLFSNYRILNLKEFEALAARVVSSNFPS